MLSLLDCILIRYPYLLLATAVLRSGQLHGDRALVLPSGHLPLRLAGDGVIVVHLSRRVLCTLPVHRQGAGGRWEGQQSQRGGVQHLIDLQQL